MLPLTQMKTFCELSTIFVLTFGNLSIVYLEEKICYISVAPFTSKGQGCVTSPSLGIHVSSGLQKVFDQFQMTLCKNKNTKN